VNLKKLVKVFLAAAGVGFAGEGLVGWLIYSATGNFLWVYPDSFFVTTSLYVIPLWGFAGLVHYWILRRMCTSTVDVEDVKE